MGVHPVGLRHGRRRPLRGPRLDVPHARDLEEVSGRLARGSADWQRARVSLLICSYIVQLLVQFYATAFCAGEVRRTLRPGVVPEELNRGCARLSSSAQSSSLVSHPICQAPIPWVELRIRRFCRVAAAAALVVVAFEVTSATANSAHGWQGLP